MGMSRSKFYRKFSALTNMGIHKYIRNYRLHVARKILLAGTLNVSQTAAEVGYSNISYFSRIFKEEFGINPSQIKPSGT
jgi:AraC-like DNA-binding protein